MKTVPLHGKKAAGRVALVDDEDYDLVMQYRWNAWERANRPGRKDGPYAQASLYLGGGRTTTIRMHCLIMGSPGVDHKNSDGLDNTRANLRLATSLQNGANQRPNLGTSSIYKGVSRHKLTGKWQVNIQVACTGRAVSLRELIGMMAAQAGYEPEIKTLPEKPEGLPYRVGDPGRLHGFYVPQVSLKEGIRRALAAK